MFGGSRVTVNICISSYDIFVSTLNSSRNPPTQLPVTQDINIDEPSLFSISQRWFKNFNRRKSKQKLEAMEVHPRLIVMLCLIASCYGGIVQSEHPQLAFCKADFGEFIEFLKILRNHNAFNKLQLRVVDQKVRNWEKAQLETVLVRLNLDIYVHVPGW